MPKVPFWVFILIAILYFTAARVDIMDIDSAQYAEITREMLKSGDYLHIYDRGMEYLDKPPFLFWVSAGSMKVFGINTFGYKFPSILFGLFAIFATYRLAKLLYGEAIGRMAALVFATCQGMFLMTNDVRCDTILVSCVVTTTWLLQEWITKRKLLYFIAASFAIGIGMLTKGPIALMVPVFCFTCDWALKRQWRNFVQPVYLLGLVIIAIMLIPMCIGLYQQFDLHPEKVVNQKSGVSGLRFYFWSQSFGRITGENPWRNNVDISFLFMNMLWSFLPWIFLFIPAIAINCVQLARQKFRLQPQQEWLTTGGFLLTYLVLGSSSYQLPHYIFVVYPLAAIIIARLFYQFIEEKKYQKLYNFMRPFQAVVASLIVFASLVLMVYVFPANIMVIGAWIIVFVLWLLLAFRKNLKGKILWLSASGMIFANIFLTNYVYYTLLKYQVGSQVGKYMRTHTIPPDEVVSYKMDDPLNAVHFYAHGIVGCVDSQKYLNGHKYILTMGCGLNDLTQNGILFDTVMDGKLFKVSELTPEFLNPSTRDKAAKSYFLVHCK